MRFALGIALTTILVSGLFGAQLVIPRSMGESWSRSVLMVAGITLGSCVIVALVGLAVWGLGADW